MIEVKQGHIFACGGCRRVLEEGSIYWVVDGIGYGICCIDDQEEKEEI